MKRFGDLKEGDNVFLVKLGPENMNPEENKVLEYLLKRYKMHKRKVRSAKTSIIETEYSGYAFEELEKILKHFKVKTE